MSTYSTQFFNGFCNAVSNDVFTAPNTGTIVLRDIEIYNNSSSPNNLIVGISASGSVRGILIDQTAAPAFTHYQWQGRVVLAPGDIVVVLTGGFGATALISGYNLS